MGMKIARAKDARSGMKSVAAKRYDRGMWGLENIGLRKLRRRMLTEVTGSILEIGVGTGANLSYYNGVDHVTAVDVHMGRLRGAVAKGLARQQSTFPYAVNLADAQQLPFAANQFDTVIGALVFCSIPYPAQALAEIQRVLKPNGRLLLLEHVRGQGAISRRHCDWLQPAWFALQHECHLNRETETAVSDAGFKIKSSSVHGFGVIQLIEAVI